MKFLSKENTAKSSVGVAALPGANVCKRVQALAVEEKQNQPINFGDDVLNEDTHQTHSSQSVSREGVAVGHLQIATVSKGIDWVHRCIPS